MEKTVATHSSTLAWKIPWMEEPGRLYQAVPGRLVSHVPWDREESGTTEWFHFHLLALEKEMAAHSNVLAWRIPGTVEPDGLPSMGLHRVGHDWSDLAAAAATYLNDLVFFPYFLKFKSAFGNKEFMIWATVNSWFCFCWLYRASPSSAAKNIINLVLDWTPGDVHV